jgi:hypothetical protein
VNFTVLGLSARQPVEPIPFLRPAIMSTQIVTCQQLYEYGLDFHQVNTLTRRLESTCVDSQSGYQLRDMITEVRCYLAASHLQPAQTKMLHQALSALLQQLDNVIEAPFGLSRDQQINFYLQKVLRTQAPFGQSAVLRAEPANVVLLKEQYSEAIPE